MRNCEFIFIYIYIRDIIYMVIPWTYGRTSQHHRFSSCSQLGCWTETLWVSGFYCLGGLWQKQIYPQQITCESRKVNDIGTMCPPQFWIITLTTVTIADIVTSSINQTVELRVNLIPFGCPTLQVWNWVRCKMVMVYTTLHWCYIATEGKYCVVISIHVCGSNLGPSTSGSSAYIQNSSCIMSSLSFCSCYSYIYLLFPTHQIRLGWKLWSHQKVKLHMPIRCGYDLAKMSWTNPVFSVKVKVIPSPSPTANHRAQCSPPSALTWIIVNQHFRHRQCPVSFGPPDVL